MAKDRGVHPNNPSITNPSFAEKLFENYSHPEAWLYVARNLRASANTILEKEAPLWVEFIEEMHRAAKSSEEMRCEHPNFDAAYMIIAFTIENLLKGIMIAKRLIILSKHEELHGILTSHNLCALQARAKPKVSASSNDLVFLTHFAEWRGRYPLPRSLDKFWPMGETGNPVVGHQPPQFQKRMDDYLVALDAELTSLCKEWVS